MNRRSPLQRLARLSRPAKRFAALAWLGAPVVELSLATVGLKRTLAWIEAVPPAPRPGERITPAEGARLVGGAYEAHLLRGECLPRALLQLLLHRRDGTAVRFVVGVARPAAGTEVAAHAWVEPLEPSKAPTEFASILVSEFEGAPA